MKKDLSDISPQEFRQLQEQIDVNKWLASERAGRDLCGSMSWCVFCVKGEEYPCAKAQFREKLDRALDDMVDEIIEKEESDAAAAARNEENVSGTESTAEAVSEAAQEEIMAEEIAESSVPEKKKGRGKDLSEEKARAAEGKEIPREEKPQTGRPEKSAQKTEDAQVPEGYELVTRYRRSFRARIIQSPVLQDLYTEIKNALLCLGGVKSRVGQNGENFRAGKERIAKLCVSGKTLSLFLALAPSLYEDTKYRFEDMTDKKTHADTPMRLKITGKRTLKQAKTLLRDLATKYGLASVGSIYTDFHYPYRDDAYLIAKKLIRPYNVVVKKKPNRR